MTVRQPPQPQPPRLLAAPGGCPGGGRNWSAGSCIAVGQGRPCARAPEYGSLVGVEYVSSRGAQEDSPRGVEEGLARDVELDDADAAALRDALVPAVSAGTTGVPEPAVPRGRSGGAGAPPLRPSGGAGGSGADQAGSPGAGGASRGSQGGSVGDVTALGCS